MLIKNLYGLFIDTGFSVEVVDRAFLAIKRILDGDISLIVLDASTFGLSVRETLDIIINVAPDMPYVIINSSEHSDSTSLDELDIERIDFFMRAIKEPEILDYKGVKNETKRSYN